MRKLFLLASIVGALCVSNANYSLAMGALSPQREVGLTCGGLGFDTSACENFCKLIGASGILGALCL